MGGSSGKSILFWKKKKTSPLSKALSRLKRALPQKKSKNKSILQKLNTNKRKKDKQKRFSLADKKASAPQKKLSLGNIRKDSLQSSSAGRKEKDKRGLERVGEQIKKTFSPEKKELSAAPEVLPASATLKAENEDKTSKKKLKWSLK